MFERDHCLLLDVDNQHFRRCDFASSFYYLLYVLMNLIQHGNEIVLRLSEVTQLEHRINVIEA